MAIASRNVSEPDWFDGVAEPLRDWLNGVSIVVMPKIVWEYGTAYEGTEADICGAASR
jgi:hypothetical protein